MSSAVDIRAPAEQTEGTRSQLLRWLKQVGESVAENEPLIELETDKVTVEVAAPATGVLREILKQEQEEIAPGELLGRLELNAPAAAGTAASEAAAQSQRPPATASDSRAGPATRAPLRTGAHAAGPLSPAVRRLLSEHGIAAGSVQGTGEGGRVTVEDVLRAAAGHTGPAAGAATPPAGTAASPEPEVMPASIAPAASVAIAGEVRRVPHTAVRKRIAEHMVQSLLHTAPHVTTVFEVNMSAVLRDRAAKREQFARRGAPLTLTAYFVRAAVAAIRAVPEANARWTESALEIYESMHIGVGTAVEGVGLVVPVLRDAGELDLFATARRLDDLVRRARAGKLAPADVRGGTFTISNHGVSGSLLAAPIIINQPQSAILGIGKLEKRAVVVDAGEEERIEVQPRCYVTLTLDHRVMDGHRANHFMATFVQTLGDWQT
ncbi:MAG: 2-oxo acid dehydrogenase subunit E2 [Gammaproteobacteria bacterium]|nr:2-oxo acid dehydrogenase subunit E2 [Gammaproteobacteria bacterium]